MRPQVQTCTASSRGVAALWRARRWRRQGTDRSGRSPMTGVETARVTADAEPVVRVTFVDLYDRHYQQLVRAATLTTGSRALAEELVQEAFVDLYRRFDALRAPEAYLRRAVVSRCTSWVRRRAVERRLAARSAPDRGAWSDPATVEVLDAITRLTARQRAAVVLRHYAGCSQREIAEALGCRPGTVKSLLSRAHQQLAKELSDD